MRGLDTTTQSIDTITRGVYTLARLWHTFARGSRDVTLRWSIGTSLVRSVDTLVHDVHVVHLVIRWRAALWCKPLTRSHAALS